MATRRESGGGIGGISLGGILVIVGYGLVGLGVVLVIAAVRTLIRG